MAKTREGRAYMAIRGRALLLSNAQLGAWCRLIVVAEQAASHGKAELEIGVIDLPLITQKMRADASVPYFEAILKETGVRYEVRNELQTTAYVFEIVDLLGRVS